VSTARAAAAPGVRPLLPTLAAMAILLAVALAAASRATAGFRAWTAEDVRRLQVTEHPAPLSDLRIVASDGRERVLWGGDPGARAWLVTFIYTRCPAVCQSLGTEFQQLQSALRSPAAAPGVRLASIAFDRAHDTPEALSGYARRHGADPATWLVAVPASGAALERLLGEAGVIVIGDGAGGFAHNAAIHVVVPPGRLVRIFAMDRHREALDFAEGISR
jgi:protein SCO1/2